MTAEERSLEAYPSTSHYWSTDPDRNAEAREFYKQGYHQAEKDLELTVDDIKNIDRLLNQCVDCSNPYQEVLKRFKERKGERYDR